MVKHFHFHDLQTNRKFDRPLVGARCVFSRDGVRCKKRCLIGLDLCWIHLRSEKNLRIKDAGALGRGLFADNGTNDKNLVFNINENIIVYDGERMNAAQKTQRYGNRTAPYLIGYDNNTFYDCAVHRCAASLINHIGHSQANVKFSKNNQDNGVRIKAIKRIYNGTQLRVSYNSQVDGNNTRYRLNENNVRTSTNTRKKHQLEE